MGVVNLFPTQKTVLSSKSCSDACTYHVGDYYYYITTYHIIPPNNISLNWLVSQHVQLSIPAQYTIYIMKWDMCISYQYIITSLSAMFINFVYGCWILCRIPQTVHKKKNKWLRYTIKGDNRKSNPVYGWFSHQTLHFLEGFLACWMVLSKDDWLWVPPSAWPRPAVHPAWFSSGSRNESKKSGSREPMSLGKWWYCTSLNDLNCWAMYLHDSPKNHDVIIPGLGRTVRLDIIYTDVWIFRLFMNYGLK